MLYTRSSFIRWLTKVKDCEIINVNDIRNRVISIKNGHVIAYIMTGKKDLMDYEEIYIVCKKLFLDLPGDTDLEKVE